MYYIKLALISVVSFVSPILVASNLEFVFENESESLNQSEVAELIELEEVTSSNEEETQAKPEIQFNQHFSATVPYDSKLDPDDQHYFVLSFKVRFKEELPEGERRKIVAKYDGNKYPYAGWSVAIHRNKTSLRPEVYWKGRTGTGGWFQFSDYEFNNDDWYRFTLIAKDKDFLGLYISTDSETTFSGAHSLKKNTLPLTKTDLHLGSQGDDFVADIAELLIAKPAEVSDSFKESIMEEPDKLVANLNPDEITLSIQSDLKDHSKYLRKVTLSTI